MAVSSLKRCVGAPLMAAKYTIGNVVRNSFPHLGVAPSLMPKHFSLENLDDVWSELVPYDSPSRKLCDLFWLTLPWQKIQQVLGNVVVLDVGCGDGGYAQKMQKWSNNLIASYVGVDVFSSGKWKDYADSSRVTFLHDDISAESFSIPDGVNFIMSQSAIEHIYNDRDFFRKVSGYVSREKRPIIQVHLFPSRACLRLYPYHGYRQYVPRTITKIARLFYPYSEVSLFSLGGSVSNKLHYETITLPQKHTSMPLRETQLREYDEKTRQAIRCDMQDKSRDASFYALVIKSHWKEGL